MTEQPTRPAAPRTPVLAADLTSFENALPAMLADIQTLVTCESPSADLAAVARSADTTARVGACFSVRPRSGSSSTAGPICAGDWGPCRRESCC